MLACALLALCACMRPPPPAPRQPLAELPAWLPPAPANDEWPGARWWQRFEDSTLDALVTEALRENPDLRRASARVAEAAALENLRLAADEPVLRADVGAAGQRFSANSTQAKLAGESFSVATLAPVDAAWHLDLWGRDRSELAAAQGEHRAAAAERQLAEVLVSTATARAWLRLSLTTGALEEARALQRNLAAQRRQLGAEVRAGLSTGVALDANRANLAEAEQRVAGLTRLDATLRHQLAVLTNQPLAQGPLRTPTPASYALPSDIPLHALARRPDLQAARERALAAGHRIDAARAAYRPDLNLRALVGFQAVGLMHALLTPASLFANVGPTLELPLFDGGRLDAQLGLREAAYREAVAAYDSRLLELVRNVEDALARHAEAGRRITAQSDAVAAAESARERAGSARRAGLTAALPLLEREYTAGLARLALLDAQAGLAAAYVDVVEALGGGTREMQETPHE